MLTRRTATVIISAPEASCAWTMTAGDEYLPVPTMSRDRKVLPAMTKLSMAMLNPLLRMLLPYHHTEGWRRNPAVDRLSAADKVHDFHFVAVVYLGRVERCALQHDEVVLHRD